MSRLYSTPLIDSSLRNIERQTPSKSFSHRFAQRVRTFPKFLYHSIAESHFRQLKRLLETFFRKNQYATVDEIFNFFQQNVLLPHLNIKEESLKRENYFIHKQIRIINDTHALLKNLAIPDATKINFINALYKLCSASLKTNTCEKENPITKEGALNFVRNTGFIVNPMVYEYSEDQLESILSDRFFIPARIKHIDFDAKACDLLRNILGNHFDIPENLTHEVIEYYSNESNTAAFFHPPTKAIYINSTSSDSLQLLMSKYANKITSPISYQLSLALHELTHYLLDTIGKGNLFKDFSLNDITFDIRNKPICFEIEEEEADGQTFTNSTAEEIIAWTTNLFNSPNWAIDILLGPNQTKYLGQASALTQGCLRMICEILEIDPEPLLKDINENYDINTFDTLHTTLGDNGYQMFIESCQKSFLNVSHQLLDHLQTKGVISRSKLS